MILDCVACVSSCVRVGVSDCVRPVSGVCTHTECTVQISVDDLGLDTVVFWTSSVVFCAVFDHSHHHNYASDEYSA